MKKALLPSRQMPDQPALTLANTVLSDLTGNPNFPTPSPALAAVQTAITTYTASLAAAKYGGRDQRAKKNADKLALINLLRQLCDYVNDNAQGDPTMLAGCGFPLSKDPQPQILGTPEVSVETGASGQIISSTPSVDGALAYKHQYSTDAAAALWPEISTSKATCKIDGLVPGQVYNFRIVAIGTNGQVTVSSIVTKMAA